MDLNQSIVCLQTFAQRNLRFPAELLLRQSDVGSTASGIIIGQRPKDQLAGEPDELDHLFGKLDES